MAQNEAPHLDLVINRGSEPIPQITYGGGGEGGGDDMESRIKRLEDDMRDIKKLLADISIVLTRVDERSKITATIADIAYLPKRIELWGLAVAIILAIIALKP